MIPGVDLTDSRLLCTESKELQVYVPWQKKKQPRLLNVMRRCARGRSVPEETELASRERFLSSGHAAASDFIPGALHPGHGLLRAGFTELH